MNNPTLLGTVQDVQGATVSVALDENTVSGLAFIDGQGYRIGQVGSFVRIPIGYVDLFGIVSQVGAGAVPEKLAATQPYGHRWMTVQLVGEGHRRGDFKRGISQHPTVGDQVHLVSEQDLSRIYGWRDSPHFVRVGHLASAESIPALIDINRLVTCHRRSTTHLCSPIQWANFSTFRSRGFTGMQGFKSTTKNEEQFIEQLAIKSFYR